MLASLLVYHEAGYFLCHYDVRWTDAKILLIDSNEIYVSPYGPRVITYCSNAR